MTKPDGKLPKKIVFNAPNAKLIKHAAPNCLEGAC